MTGISALTVDVKDEMPTVSRRNWLLLGSLYSTQFLGPSFFVVALVAILRERGASLEAVGLVYLLGFVWPLKLLWAPLIDRLGFGRLGHYRGWLLLTQTLLSVTLLSIGAFDVIEDFAVVYGLCILVAIASATQDIAVDGLACRLLGPADRGFGNGIQIAGGLLGNLVGGGLMLMAYPMIGWTGCMVLMAAATILPLLQILTFREPKWPTATATTGQLFLRFGSFWRKPGRGYWLLLLAIFPAGSAIAYAVVTPILVDAGWDLGRIGFSVNILGSIAGLLSALATGWLLGRYGRHVILTAAGLLQVIAVVAIAIPTSGHADHLVAGVAVVVFFLCYNPAATVLAALMMDQASPDAPSTDYTLQYTLYQFVAIATMTIAAALSGSLGYLGVLAIGAATAVIATLLSLGYSARPEASATAISETTP